MSELSRGRKDIDIEITDIYNAMTPLGFNEDETDRALVNLNTANFCYQPKMDIWRRV